ncbi:site-specific integrase [Herbidospora cretacea]|uniref:site-specific integrase n=1 Tax=Herbidospora cretacea TaxID=28444 RepID=UPI000773A596|nr:site-specific integrase [Herbidospora cretacea]
MTKRRSRGDGGLHWDPVRERWIATVTVGYTPAGKRIVKKASDKDKTKAREKLKAIIKDYEDGLTANSHNYTVADTVKYWLTHGLKGRDPRTVTLYTEFAENHIISALGARKLRDLSVEDVDKWLADKSASLSTRTLKMLHSILNRAVKNAMRRDKVKRNVVDLCEVPEGRVGRPSKAFTLDQASALLAATEQAHVRMCAYIVLSLLTGARTEELRALTWPHVVTFDKEHKAWRPVGDAGWGHGEFAMYVWRSVRRKGDTKTAKSRRTLKLPQRCARALHALWESQDNDRQQPNAELVFRTQNGTALSAGNVRRDFRKVVNAAGLDGDAWTPKELRHSFVSLLSDSGVPIEDISRLVGHANTVVTETVYRHQIRPVMQEGATAMDVIFRS